MRKKRRRLDNSARDQFVNELAAQRAKHPTVLRGVEPRGVRLGYRRVDLELDTTQMQRAAGGMMARDIEPVVVWVPPDAMGPIKGD